MNKETISNPETQAFSKLQVFLYVFFMYYHVIHMIILLGFHQIKLAVGRQSKYAS